MTDNPYDLAIHAKHVHYLRVFLVSKYYKYCRDHHKQRKNRMAHTHMSSPMTIVMGLHEPEIKQKTQRNQELIE